VKTWKSEVHSYFFFGFLLLHNIFVLSGLRVPQTTVWLIQFYQRFYAPQLYRQVLLRRVLAMGILSVCLSVCLSVTTRWYTKPRWDRDSWSSPYDSLKSLVSNEVIWCRWVRRFPSNEGIKEGYPPYRNRFFTTIGSSSVKTVADRRRLAVYHSKHCWRAFQWYQHRWPWTTLNPKIGVFSEFLAILGCNTHFKTELRRNPSR